MWGHLRIQTTFLVVSGGQWKSLKTSSISPENWCFEYDSFPLEKVVPFQGWHKISFSLILIRILPWYITMKNHHLDNIIHIFVPTTWVQAILSSQTPYDHRDFRTPLSTHLRDRPELSGSSTTAGRGHGSDEGVAWSAMGEGAQI